MKPQTPEEALRYCLENPDSLSTEQLLDQFPDYREELQSLLAFDRRLADALPQERSATGRTATKQRLMASVAGRGTAQPAQPTQPAQPAQPVQPAQPASAASAAAARTDRATAHAASWHRRAFWSRRPAWLFALLTLLVLLWYLFSNALPGSPLYGGKLTAENLSLSFANGPADLARGHILLANQRLYDLRALQLSGRLEQAGPGFESYSDHLQIGGGIWRSLEGPEHADLTKLLYVSTVAGQLTFEGFTGAVGALPTGMQVRIETILNDLRTLNAVASQELRAAGQDLDQLLRGAQNSVVALLTPVPGAVAITPAPTPMPCMDTYEDDGVPAQAKIIKVGETQLHLFCPATDADWLMFFGKGGQVYKFETSQLSTGVDTYMYLFAPDARTILARDGDAPDARGPSRIVFRPERDDWYYIQIKNHGDVGRPGLGYSVTLSLAETTATTPTP